MAALLPRSLSNFRTIGKVQTSILQLWDFTRSCGETSIHLVNRGPVSSSLSYAPIWVIGSTWIDNINLIWAVDSLYLFMIQSVNGAYKFINIAAWFTNSFGMNCTLSCTHKKLQFYPSTYWYSPTDANTISHYTPRNYPVINQPASLDLSVAIVREIVVFYVIRIFEFRTNQGSNYGHCIATHFYTMKDWLKEVLTRYIPRKCGVKASESWTRRHCLQHWLPTPTRLHLRLWLAERIWTNDYRRYNINKFVCTSAWPTTCRCLHLATRGEMCMLLMHTRAWLLSKCP